MCFFCIWYHYYISHHVHFPSDTAHLTMVRGCSSMAEISLLNRKNNIICNELNMCYLCIFPQVLLPLFNGKFMFFFRKHYFNPEKNHVNINSLITCDTMGLHFYMSLEKKFDFRFFCLWCSFKLSVHKLVTYSITWFNYHSYSFNSNGFAIRNIAWSLTRAWPWHYIMFNTASLKCVLIFITLSQKMYVSIYDLLI